MFWEISQELQQKNCGWKNIIHSFSYKCLNTPRISNFLYSLLNIYNYTYVYINYLINLTSNSIHFYTYICTLPKIIRASSPNLDVNFLGKPASQISDNLIASKTSLIVRFEEKNFIFKLNPWKYVDKLSFMLSS